jgi:hypothetical protein
MPSEVTTRLIYRKPPPTPEFLLTPIDLYTEDPVFKDERQIAIKNIRSEIDRFNFEKDGIEFLKHALPINDWDDEDEVWRVVLEETPALVKRR